MIRPKIAIAAASLAALMVGTLLFTLGTGAAAPTLDERRGLASFGHEAAGHEAAPDRERLAQLREQWPEMGVPVTPPPRRVKGNWAV